MNWWGPSEADVAEASKRPTRVSVRTLGRAIEETLMGKYTRAELEVVLPDELDLPWTREDDPRDDAFSKRALVQAYLPGWTVPQLAGLGRRILAEHDVVDLGIQVQLDAYDLGGGVQGSTKNLIFAANGPKPDIVLRDAMSNDIEIVANAEYCLVYDQPIPADGLSMRHLAGWWLTAASMPEGTSDHEAALALHARLATCLDSPAERVVFDAYTTRYKTSLDIPALIPQVYLHYDPQDQRLRRASAVGAPLERQRMDFLLLFSDRRRVVIEVDGKQHYANGDKASPPLYARMVAEDRPLKLAGYEVFRFGGGELFDEGSQEMVEEFFDQLAERMK